MTVICWDGKTLASDRQSTTANMRRMTKKIYRLSDGLLALTGGGIHGHELLAWFQGDRDVAKWPKLAGDDSASVIHITKAGVLVYSGDLMPFGEPVLNPFIAFGSGRDYAMAAMHLGRTAAEAVEIASLFDVSCGMGVDTLEL